MRPFDPPFSGIVGARDAAVDVYPYEIDYSALFESGSLTRTFPTAGNRRTWTFNVWVKRASLDSGFLFYARPASGQGDLLYFGGDGYLLFYTYDSGYTGRCFTNAIFQDTTNWMMITLVFDSTNATASERIRLYVNGERLTDLSQYTDPGLNYETFVNSACQHIIGSHYEGSQPFGGYIARPEFVGGVALEPTAFGGFSSHVSGLWVPAEFAGDYSTNGCVVDLANADELGADVSGNGNAWTVMGTLEQVAASPTNNNCVFNPHRSLRYGGLVLSNGNRTLVSDNDSQWAAKPCSMEMRGGKYYGEMVMDSVNTSQNNYGVAFGVCGIAGEDLYPGKGDFSDSHGVLTESTGAYVYSNGTYTQYPEVSPVAGDVIRVALDIDTGEGWVGVNDTWLGGGSPAAGTGAILTLSEDAYLFCAGSRYTTCQGTLQLAESDLSYAPPAGFNTLCAANLPEPEPLDPSTGAAVVLREGTGATAIVSGVPNDLVLIKSRDNAVNWHLFDSVRGAGNALHTNTPDAEFTDLTRLSAFTEDGYELGSQGGVNASGYSYVDLCLKRGPEFGLDIVAYTGDGAARQIAHNCGGVPEMIIVKCRDTDGYSWRVYHEAIGPTKYLSLNSGGAAVTGSGYWNDTAPNSTHFTVGNDLSVNESGKQYIAYVFRSVTGFSKVFSYECNGNADGPYIDLGFTPLAVIKKDANQNVPWYMFNSAVDPLNPVDTYLYPNDTQTELTSIGFSAWSSSGYKITNTSTALNTNGNTVVGIAFAAQPAKYSNAF